MTQQQKIIKHKLGVLALAKQLGNAAQACKIMGYSPQEAAPKELGGAGDRAGGVGDAIEQPANGQVRVANKLAKRGVMISRAGVSCVWQCHDLEHFENHLKALEAKMALERLILTDSQLAALERAKAEEEHGEIETEHPGMWAPRTPSMSGQ